jgi:hypothetical protein
MMRQTFNFAESKHFVEHPLTKLKACHIMRTWGRCVQAPPAEYYGNQQ